MDYSYDWDFGNVLKSSNIYIGNTSFVCVERGRPMTKQILSKMYQPVNASEVKHCRFAIHALHPIGAFVGSGESEKLQVCSLCQAGLSIEPCPGLRRTYE
jgi:hypothetical protein